MKQSRFKEIIREELALSRVKLCEATGDTSDRRTLSSKGAIEVRAALDALTSAWHKVGEAEDAVGDDEELARELHNVYATIGNKLIDLRASLRKLNG